MSDRINCTRCHGDGEIDQRDGGTKQCGFCDGVGSYPKRDRADRANRLTGNPEERPYVGEAGV